MGQMIGPSDSRSWSARFTLTALCVATFSGFLCGDLPASGQTRPLARRADFGLLNEQEREAAYESLEQELEYFERKGMCSAESSSWSVPRWCTSKRKRGAARLGIIADGRGSGVGIHRPVAEENSTC
jgi:hypothetical protein